MGEVVAPSVGGGLTRGAVVTMADLSTLEVEVDVNEAYIGRIAGGRPARITLDAYPDTSFRGEVRQVVPTADRQRATVQVKVSILDHDARILPEMGAKVDFLEPEQPRAGRRAGAHVDPDPVRCAQVRRRRELRLAGPRRPAHEASRHRRPRVRRLPRGALGAERRRAAAGRRRRGSERRDESENAVSGRNGYGDGDAGLPLHAVTVADITIRPPSPIHVPRRAPRRRQVVQA